jgi:hypothetical protein
MKRIFSALCVLSLNVFGASLPQEEAVRRALSWMSGNPVMQEATRRGIAAVEIFPDNGGYSVYVVQFSSRGYLVLNSDDRLPLVVSFSAESVVDLADTEQNAFRAMLLRHGEQMEAQLARPAVMQTQSMDAESVTAGSELHGPFLETTWNQCNPYNLLCPDDPGGIEYYDYRVPVGCTPTAYAQILHYHRWPLQGEGAHSYTDGLGSTIGAHSAVFSDPFDWGAMLPSYDAWNANLPAAEDAVAELMYELGVAADANYESGGTSSSIWTLGQRLEDYFFFESCNFQSSQTALLSPMEADLRAGFPCVVAIPGHAIVADGLMVDSGVTTYHINYGWGGSNNGWWSAGNVAGNALQYGVTSLRPLLMAFPATNALAGVSGEAIELQWILPKRRETEAEELTIYRLNEQNGTWQPFAVDDTLASRRFASVTTDWVDCNDFSEFEVTSSSTYKDWGISTTSGVDSCFYKQPGGYGNREYHLTSYSTITPTASTRLLLRAKYNLASDRFRVLVSSNGSTFTEIWSTSASMDWSETSIDLFDYAGQPIYVRLEYVPGSYYPNGGVWIDSIAIQEVTHPELEGQPVHYTVLTNLPSGTHTLAAVLTDTGTVEHARGPSFTLTVSGVPDDGDGMPADWEAMYGLNTNVNDADLDPDSDGYSNLQEYICGTVPTNAGSCWMLESGNGSLPAFLAKEGRVYTIRYRTSLTSGTWLPLAADLPGSNHVVNISAYDAATNAARYYRVEVRKTD